MHTDINKKEPNTKGKCEGRLTRRLFIRKSHRRRAQLWHALSTDHTVLAAAHAFIREWNVFAFQAEAGPHLKTPERFVSE